jgi:SAM-dependent methyltransferase
MAESFSNRLRRGFRWLAGRGWSAEDFARRYARGSSDAWGYNDAPKHQGRAEWILGALPADRFANALEVGCAQGFLSRRLAGRAERLVACDISEAAIRQARESCAAFPGIAFHVADIRDGFPGADFDLCLFSDVLYYLSPRENDAVLDEARRMTAPGGFLVIVNEWNDRYRGLTPPSHAFARLDANAGWKREDFRRETFDGTALTLGAYRRLP